MLSTIVTQLTSLLLIHFCRGLLSFSIGVVRSEQQGWKNPQLLTTSSHQPYADQSSRSSLATHTSEIVYASQSLPLTDNYGLNLKQEALPLNNHLNNFAVASSSVALSTSYQQKGHSNQKHYAPKRRIETNIHSTHAKLLPYPPSFISITSTSTTSSPPRDAQRNNTDFSGRGSVSQLPDIFVKRQYKSLLASYIPSWVMARMLQQQQKWLEQRQSHKFLNTHTLAYPIMKKYA